MDAAVLADHIVHGEYLSESFGDALGALSSEAISDEEAERFADQLVVGGALRAALQILLQSPAPIDLAQVCIKFIGAVSCTASPVALWSDATLRDPSLLPVLYNELTREGQQQNYVFVCDVLGRMWQQERTCRDAMKIADTAIFINQLCFECGDVTRACELVSRLARFDFREDGPASLALVASILALLSGALEAHAFGGSFGNTPKGSARLYTTWFEILDDWADQQWEMVRDAVQPKLLLATLRLGDADATIACLDMLTHFRCEAEEMAPDLVPFLVAAMCGYRRVMRAVLRLLIAAPGLLAALLEPDSSLRGMQVFSDTVIPNLWGTDREMRRQVLKLCVALCVASRTDIVIGWHIDFDQLLDELNSPHGETDEEAEEEELLECLKSYVTGDTGEGADELPWE